MLPSEHKTCIEEIVGSFLYYGWVIDIALLKALNGLGKQ